MGLFIVMERGTEGQREREREREREMARGAWQGFASSKREYLCHIRLGARSTCGPPHDVEALPLQISEHDLHLV